MNEVIQMSVIAFGIMVGCSAIGAAVGLGVLGSRFLDALARQPEMGAILQTKMFVVVGLVDALPIIGLGLALMLVYANPFLSLVQP